MNKDRKLAHITKLIQLEVGWFNGWGVSQEDERESCEKAAKKILRYLAKKSPTQTAKETT